MPIDSYGKIRKIRAVLTEEVEIEFPSLSLTDKLMLVEMRVQSNILAQVDEKATDKDSIKRNASNQ